MCEAGSQINPDSILNNAVIVAAHPDDEILWFSSIIKKVARVFICYMGHKSKPDWTEGRLKAIQNYPLPSVMALNLDAAEVYNCANWRTPQVSTYGLQLKKGKCNKSHYENNYRSLEYKFRELLAPYPNVFTHNPWGEYGHEEHVQIFRVISHLQAELEFALWVDNYVSNHSMPFMLKYIPTIRNQFFCAPTDKKIAETIRDLYVRHGCWTWYPDFQWREQEAFLRLGPDPRDKRRIGRSFPINLVDIGEENNQPKRFIKLERLRKRIGRLKRDVLKTRSN
jgi:LmbE family N-acetylglucosaminyl deacetylase